MVRTDRGIGLAVIRVYDNVLEVCQLKGSRVLNQQVIIMLAQLAKQSGVEKVRCKTVRPEVGRKFLALGFTSVGEDWYELAVEPKTVAEAFQRLKAS
jgi:hypothetical protein